MSLESLKCPACDTDQAVSDSAAQTYCDVCGTLIYREESVSLDPQESRRYIQKAKNSGNAAEAYGYCRQATQYDPSNSAAWAERFCISFWLNSELKGTTMKNVVPDEQLQFLAKALEATDEAAKHEVIKIITRFYISESAIDQHIRLNPNEVPSDIVQFQQFVSTLPASQQKQLKEELIYLTGESLNKSLSANCRANNKQQKFLNLCACISFPVPPNHSLLYLRIYETLESMTSSSEAPTRTGFMCLISSDKPDVAQENQETGKIGPGPNYQLSDWPLGVQIVSLRLPEDALSFWLVQWFFAYQAFLEIKTNDLTTETYPCLGNSEAISKHLDAFMHTIEAAFFA